MNEQFVNKEKQMTNKHEKMHNHNSYKGNRNENNETSSFLCRSSAKKRSW